MDEAVLEQIFAELLEALETVETQSAALLQFLKAKGIANDEDFAPYFEQASKASSVRSVATRARINRLLSAAAKHVDESGNDNIKETAARQPTQSTDAESPAGNSKEATQETSAEKEDQSASDQETPERDSTPSAETKRSSEENEGEPQAKPRTQLEAA
jgi:hypothetical protein